MYIQEMFFPVVKATSLNLFHPKKAPWWYYHQSFSLVRGGPVISWGNFIPWCIVSGKSLLRFSFQVLVVNILGAVSFLFQVFPNLVFFLPCAVRDLP